MAAQRRVVGARRFALQVAVDTVAIVGGVLLLGLFTVPEPFPFGAGRVPIVQVDNGGLAYFLLSGLGLTVGNIILRPIIVAVTGRLLIWSMGLFSVVITALVLFVTGTITPLQITMADPWWGWLLLLAFNVQVIGALLAAILGLTRPSLAPDRATQGVWGILDTLPTPRRNAILENLRLQQVYDTLIRFGVEITVDRTPFRAIRLWSERYLIGEPDPVAGMSTPRKVAAMLQQLGPTYVKVGQMAASQGASLPDDWAEELARLQSDVAPFPWAQAKETIERQVGRPVLEAFASIDEIPFAAASTAQVHRATLSDGSEVAVKVQRPEIVAMTKADLGVMQEISRVAERRVGFARRIDLHGIVTEFATGVLRELDYRNEAYQAKRLQAGMAKFQNVGVPHVYSALSGERVLTMEFVRGIKISHVDELEAAGLDRAALGAVFIRALIKQVLVDGFFHGDPHPGNLFVVPETGRIVFIDCGLVGELDSPQRTALLDLIYSLKTNAFDSIATALIRLSERTPEFDEAAFRSRLDRQLRQFMVYGDNPDLATALSSVLATVYSSGLRLDTNLTMAIKAIIQATETAAILAPDIDLGDAAIQEARDSILAQLTPEKVKEVAQAKAIEVGKELLSRVPTLEAAAWSWLDQFGRGKLVVQIDTSDLDRQLTQINAAGRRLSTGMIVVGQLIGTAILAVVALQPSVAASLGFIPGLAITAFLVTLAYSFYVLIRGEAGGGRSTRGSGGD